MNIEFQVAISVLTVLGAGVSVFVAMRVSVAELKVELRDLKASLAKNEVVMKESRDEMREFKKELDARILYIERERRKDQ